MKHPRIAALPGAVWLLWLTAAGLSVAASVLATLVVLSGDDLGLDVYTVVFLVLAPIYATVGVTIVTRASGNRVGWVLLLIGVLMSIENFSGDTANYAATAVGRWVPGGVWMNWISSWIWLRALGVQS